MPASLDLSHITLCRCHVVIVSVGRIHDWCSVCRPPQNPIPICTWSLLYWPRRMERGGLVVSMRIRSTVQIMTPLLVLLCCVFVPCLDVSSAHAMLGHIAKWMWRDALRAWIPLNFMTMKWHFVMWSHWWSLPTAHSSRDLWHHPSQTFLRPNPPDMHCFNFSNSRCNMRTSKKRMKHWHHLNNSRFKL
jgi:hypothetical protein